MTTKETTTTVFLPDIHVPLHDTKAMKSVCKYLSTTHVDKVVIGGDFLDFDFISSHNAGALRKIENGRFEDQYKAGAKMLDMLQESALTLNADCTFDYLEGNHDFRCERFVDANPAMEGIIEVPIQLDLKNRNINWVPCWSKDKVVKVGKLILHHGRPTSKYHAAIMAASYGKSIAYGHTHDVQSHSLVYKGDNATIVAQSCGCLCQYSMPYLNGRPTKWQQGFGVIQTRSNGFFNLNVVRIFNGEFISPDGRIYAN